MNHQRLHRGNAFTDDTLPALMESDISTRAYRRSWARLIQKVYQVDPLLCPKCRGEMRIISFIEDMGVVEKILRHLGLWKTRNHDPPGPDVPRSPDFVHDDRYSQVAAFDDYLQ